MENFNFPPVAFARPDCPDDGSTLSEASTNTSDEGSNTSSPTASPSATTGGTSESVFQEFAIVLHNIHHFESIPTGEWLALLQEKAGIRRKFDLREADRLQNLSAQLSDNDEPDRAMIHITQALYRCPPDSTLEKAILCQKGDLLRRRECVQDAIRHLEHCLRIEGERFSFGTYLCLLRCYKAMGNVRKVRTTLARCATFFNRWKDEFQRYDSQLKNEPDAHMEEMKKEFDLHANCIPMEIVIDKSFRNEPAVQDDYEEEIDLEPFGGYTTDSKIHGASSACSLEVDGQTTKLVANTFIPEGSIVLIERPLASHLEFSKVQCYTCHVVQPHLIPCFHCQGVFYCSYQCQGKDADYHRFECRGYQLLFFPLVNGNLELRMLVRTMDALRQTLVKKAPSTIKSLRTAEDLFRVLLDSSHETDPPLSNALLLKLDYSGFRAEDFDALMIKTEKLLSYVKFDGRLRSHFFPQWKHLVDLQFDVFIGGLLLHFCTLTMTKVNRLSFEIPVTEEFVGRYQDCMPAGGTHEEQPLRETVLETLERYGKSAAARGAVDTEHLREGVLRHLEMLRSDYVDTRKAEPAPTDLCHQVWSRANVKRLWQNCLESAELRNVKSYETVVLSHQRQPAGDVVSGALMNFFDSYFDHFGEIPICNSSQAFPNTLRAFYPTAMRLKHSCGPNLYFAMISNGLFVARARYDINQGEELTLNHGPHFKDAPRDERRDYLRKIYINCDCMECGQIEDHWIRFQRVKCDECIFNPNAPQICPQCLQSRELPWELEVLVQQLQGIESGLLRNHNASSTTHQLVPVSALGRSAAAAGFQLTASGPASSKRKIEMLKFFERIWQMSFVDQAINVPLYNNLKGQLACFADEAIRDAIDDVYMLVSRCKKIIDTLLPHMSVQVANEYELVIRRAVKYMLPAKFLGGDMRQVHRTVDLSRSMIRHAFTILEGHFLYEDESYFKLLKVEGSLRLIEENIRNAGALEERDLFFTLMGLGDVKRPKGDDHQKRIKKSQSAVKSAAAAASAAAKQQSQSQSAKSQVIVDLQNVRQESKSAFLRDAPPLTNGSAEAHELNGGDSSCGSSTTSHSSSSDDSAQTVRIINNADQGEESKEQPSKKADKNAKRKETGAIPKPSRTTKHHRKV